MRDESFYIWNITTYKHDEYSSSDKINTVWPSPPASNVQYMVDWWLSVQTSSLQAADSLTLLSLYYNSHYALAATTQLKAGDQQPAWHDNPQPLTDEQTNLTPTTWGHTEHWYIPASSDLWSEQRPHISAIKFYSTTVMRISKFLLYIFPSSAKKNHVNCVSLQT